jgi:hypothetical protein
LRPSQGFDARKIEHGKARGVDRARVAVVLIHGDRRFLLIAIVVLGDTANVEHHLRGGIGVHLQARHRADQIRRGVHIQVGERFIAERRDRDPDVLQVLLAALGSHHDLLGLVRARRRALLCIGNARHCERGARYQRENQSLTDR